MGVVLPYQEVVHKRERPLTSVQEGGGSGQNPPNSLSFPHEHPKGWRSFTYGWLYLPVNVIGRYVPSCGLWRVILMSSQAVQREDEAADASAPYLEGMVGRDDVPIAENVCAGSRFQREDVRCKY